MKRCISFLDIMKCRIIEIKTKQHETLKFLEKLWTYWKDVYLLYNKVIRTCWRWQYNLAFRWSFSTNQLHMLYCNLILNWLSDTYVMFYFNPNLFEFLAYVCRNHISCTLQCIGMVIELLSYAKIALYVKYFVREYSSFREIKGSTKCFL